MNVLMNPPYSASWAADKELINDSRFSEFEKLAPKSKADFAFVLHGFSKLENNGKMAVVLPHGVLFRGAAEGVIRKKLLEINAIEAVIGLPANLFYGTSIPTVYIVLKKNRTQKDVLFIDASKEFGKGKNQNFLEDEHIQKILDVYQNRKEVEKYSHLASFEEIQENDYNLNIPRYVDTFEEEEPIDIVAVGNEILQLDKEIKAAEKELAAMIGELVVTDETREMINTTLAVFGGKPIKKKSKDDGQLSLFE